MKLLIPVHTRSETNQREHWAVRHRRRKAQRQAARLLFAAAIRFNRALLLWSENMGTLVITLTRIAPRMLDGHDNLSSSLKATVDGIADALRVDDKDERIMWRYAQRKGKPKEYAVEVEVENEEEARRT